MNNNQITRLLKTLLRGRNGRNPPKLGLLLVGLVVAYVVVQPILKSRWGIHLPSIGDPTTQSARVPTNRSTSSSVPFPTVSDNQPPTLSTATRNPSTKSSRSTGLPTSEGERKILDGFENRKSDFLVQCQATVKKNLADDNVGARHQKAILRLASGHTVMLAHNIDLADKVPMQEGDEIEFFGEYEYSEQGGVVHWTHHDPGKRRRDGWIRHNNVTYK